MSVYRDAGRMRGVLSRIAAIARSPHAVMEVCGGQTWTLSRYRLEELLPATVSMVHGPGCPVCVTPASTIDAAIAIAMRSDVIFCSFGDMLRVPGSELSLLQAKAAGADVRLLYSPLDALNIARANPDRQVVFFAIGFETTMPVYALMVRNAPPNLSLLTSLFTVPAAVRAVKADAGSRLDALLAAGHVCAVTGTAEYEELSRELNIPIVVTGFEPLDMLAGIERAVEMLENGRNGVDNMYTRAVRSEGNLKALAAIDEVFQQCDASWRGIGVIPRSGKKLKASYEQCDAWVRFNIKPDIDHCRPEECMAHLIMKGIKNPKDCVHFAASCTPLSPIGAPMVSDEGVCAAYYKYQR